MRALLVAALALGCASRNASAPAYVPEPPGDASVAATDDAAGIAAGETAWLVAHLADDPDPANPRESEAVRRLAAMGEAGLRAAVEVFRVGDARRAPFARRVFERVVERRCRHALGRTTRTLRAMQGAGTDPDAGEAPRWLDRSEGRWSNEAVERTRAWIDAGARCAE